MRSYGLSRNRQSLLFLAKPFVWVLKNSGDSKALRPHPRKDSEEDRRFPCLPTRRYIFMTFCDAVRFFNISAFDVYVQEPKHQFYYLYIFMFLPTCTWVENWTVRLHSRSLLFCRDLFKILQSPHECTLSCTCTSCSKFVRTLHGSKDLNDWESGVRGKLFASEFVLQELFALENLFRAEQTTWVQPFSSPWICSPLSLQACQMTVFVSHALCSSAIPEQVCPWVCSTRGDFVPSIYECSTVLL